MKKLLSLLALCLVLSALCITLTACSGEEEDLGDVTVLNVYNWGEYISDGSLGTYDTNAEFEKYCKEVLKKNVKVVYTTYATNEDMEAKISSGAGTYDIIVPSDYMIEKLIANDMLYAFDPKVSVPNYQYIKDQYKEDQDVVLSVRPEEFLLNPESHSEGILAKVDDCVFLGLMTHYFVHLETGEEVEIIQESSIDSIIEPGTMIKLTLNTDKVNIFTADGSDNMVTGVQNDCAQA